MTFRNTLWVLFLLPTIVMGQEKGISKDFAQELKSLIKGTVPTITVEELDSLSRDVIILDTREKAEYEVSRIPGAHYIGYSDFKLEEIPEEWKDKEIVVYCSVGYRSEKIGEELMGAGIKQVRNLYGSIFAWANAGLPLENTNGEQTKLIHTYDDNWGKWMINKGLMKIW